MHSIPTPEVTFVVEYTYDRTLDYTPSWSNAGTYTDEADANRTRDFGNESGDGEVHYRVRRVRGPRPEGGYSDPVDEQAYQASVAFHQSVVDEAAAKEARTPTRGKTVRVIAGRKAGVEGQVIWFGHRFTDRVGIKDSAGDVHWVDADKVEVVNEVSA